MWRVNIPKFSKILVKSSVLWDGNKIVYICTDRGEIWHGGAIHSSKSKPNFTPSMQHMSLLRGEKPQDLPVSNLNTGVCAVCNAAGNKVCVRCAKYYRNNKQS